MGSHCHNVAMYIIFFFKCENYYCHYETSGCHSNDLSSVNSLYERKLFKIGTSEKNFVLVYRICSLSTDDILM
jgi:hypothetical protein